jgi:DNA-binding NarL/FixJ family response regulator
VLLVEDNDAYRDSLAFLLGRRDGIEVVGAVATGEAAAPTCEELDVDVAVVDLRLPDIGGVEVAENVRVRSPATRVVFLSASAGPDERDAARLAGAPLVQKDDGIETLAHAVLGERGEV